MDGESESEREQRLKTLWSKLDTKRKGYLDLPALKSGLAQMNHPLKDADGLIRDMLSACDINQDGHISYDEFVRFCSETEKELWVLFQSIDRDKNGNLDKSELSQAFERAGVAVSNARLDRFFGYIDKNHDGSIDFPEWRDFLLFIPTHAPGLKQVFNYYTTTVKLTAEGDVNLSDEALSSFGEIARFIKINFFGAITQIYETAPQPSRKRKRAVSSPQASPNMPTEDRSLAIGSYEIEHFTHPDGTAPPQLARPSDPSTISSRQHKRIRLTDLVPSTGYFAAGGLAGITSRTATAPLDRLKVYLIAQTGSVSEAAEAVKNVKPVAATKHGASTLWGACKDVWKAGGIRSLFAGNGLNVLKVMPESAVKFGSYEASKRAIAKLEGHNDPKHISSWSLFTCGGVAGMISQAVVYPLDTLKFRIQCEMHEGGLKGNQLVLATLQKMWRTNGVYGFYRGLPMGLVGMFPYSAIDLFIFERLKRTIVKRNMRLHALKHEEDALPGNFSLALIGGFSGAIGASAVYPVNLLRTRLQSQGTSQHPRTYTGIVDVTRQTIRGEGVRGLFKGLTPNLLKVVPAVSITYVVYENSKKAMKLS